MCVCVCARVCVCVCVPLGLVSVCLLGFVFVSRVASCMESCALQDPTLVCFDVWVPSFFLFGIFAVAVFVFLFFFCFLSFSLSLSVSLSLSLSLSLRRWGNANPSAVCVSPCVSSSWPQTCSAARTSSPPPASRNCSSTYFFCLWGFWLCFLKRDRSGLTGHHTLRPCTCFFVRVSFCCCAALLLPPVLAVRPFSSCVFSGCVFWPCAFPGFSRNIVGLSLLASSDAFSRTLGGKGVFVFFCLVLVFSPFVLLATPHVFTRRPGP